MKNFIPDLIGRAALSRIDHGDELTWDKVADRIEGFSAGMTKRELELVVGYLAASILTRNGGTTSHTKETTDMGNEPTERDVEGLAQVLHSGAAGTETKCEHSEGFVPCEHDARAVLTSDWYAERIAQASTEPTP